MPPIRRGGRAPRRTPSGPSASGVGGPTGPSRAVVSPVRLCSGRPGLAGSATRLGPRSTRTHRLRRQPAGRPSARPARPGPSSSGPGQPPRPGAPRPKPPPAHCLYCPAPRPGHDRPGTRPADGPPAPAAPPPTGAGRRGHPRPGAPFSLARRTRSFSGTPRMSLATLGGGCPGTTRPTSRHRAAPEPALWRQPSRRATYLLRPAQDRWHLTGGRTDAPDSSRWAHTEANIVRPPARGARRAAPRRRRPPPASVLWASRPSRPGRLRNRPQPPAHANASAQPPGPRKTLGPSSAARA